MTGRLAPQPWMVSARRVVQALEAARPGSARFVGGCVRNALLGAPVGDIDIATQLTPDQVTTAMLAARIAVHPTGIEHGTVTVVADHQPFEVTTLRRDIETDGRRAVVAFTEDWAEDAQRRDFRMNALYAEPDGTLHDPTGGGLDDVAARRIMFVGDPETRIREDYLRILRFFRFNAWYGDGALDAAGLAACAKLKGGLAGISVERIWMETKKLLGAQDPLPALAAMQTSGVLADLLPESSGLALLSGLVALESASGTTIDAMRRFLSLFWKDEQALATVARRWKLSNDERDRLVYAARCDAPLADLARPADFRRILYRHGGDIIRDNLLLGWAGQGASARPDMLAQIDAYVRPVMPVSGDEVLAAGVAPGPAVGAAMRKLEAAWIESDFTADRNTLLGLVK
jgi:poly(A) polymerase